MEDVLIAAASGSATPIERLRAADLDAFSADLDERARAWLDRAAFRAKPGQVAWLPDADGLPARVLVGVDGSPSLATLGGLPLTLPAGDYKVVGALTELEALGWATGAYQFARYRERAREAARLVLPAALDAQALNALAFATTLTRDLINTPAADMLPSHLAAEAEALAERHNAGCTILVGEELVDAGLHTIHAVGRAADDAPRLIDIEWGDQHHPEIVLIGKGVCFDSGGLDIKPAGAMRTMKKDMGGAAHVLGLAHLIMTARLPVRLRVLVPAVENAISGNAFRPGDVIATRKGLTVEIDNTDAEGRLVLCDAMAVAAERKPALMIDFATLTGAARTAVGTELAAMFSNDDTVADAISAAGAAVDDPVWRMPLHQPYAAMLDSKVADLVNSASSPYAGAITAALFLERFAENLPWVHFDIMAWNIRARPGRPEGGEAMGMRAVFEYLRTRFAP
ncbi:MAG: leucyl aminopeptidase family protein [Pseudomonadales bacterium]